MSSLVIYYSRPGQNYVNGNIIDLPIGNTQIIVDYIKEFTNLDVTSKLQKNDIHCEMKSQPNFPVLDLRIDEQSYVFNSLYRVWMIESIFSNVLEHRYKSEINTDSE